VCVYRIVETKVDTEDLTQCCQCHKLMKNPVLLPCSDAFCQTCLTDSDVCPTCGEALEMSSEAASNYRDKFLSRLVELRSVEVDLCPARDRCELCEVLPGDESYADYYCMDCHQRLCAECQCRHRRGTFTVNHTIVQLGTTVSNDLLQVGL